MTHQPQGLAAREQGRLARLLVDATRRSRPVPPLTERHPDLSPDDAARIRDLALAQRLASGERLVGAKVSLAPGTTAGRLGAPRPALGWVTDAMLLPAGVLNVGELIRPRVEPRLALRLRQPLRGPIRTASDLLAATERAHLALEIVDSRYDRDSLGIVDHIADNCGASRLLLGEGVAPPAEGTLRRLRVHLDAGNAGSVIGDGAAPPWSALEASVWLADRLTRNGRNVVSDALLVAPAGSAAIDLRPGVRVRARDSELGGLELWG